MSFSLHPSSISPDEYDDWYGAYLRNCGEKELISWLAELKTETLSFFEERSDEWLRFAYDSGKWTPLDLLGHLADTELIFAMRLLCVLRHETSPIPGFDQDRYVLHQPVETLGCTHLLRRFESARDQTLLLCEELNDSNASRILIADGHAMSARALVGVIAGHNKHHLNVLKERYILPQ